MAIETGLMILGAALLFGVLVRKSRTSRRGRGRGVGDTSGADGGPYGDGSGDDCSSSSDGGGGGDGGSGD